MAGDFEMKKDVKDLELLLIPNIRFAFLDVFLDFSLGAWLGLKKKERCGKKKNNESNSLNFSALGGGGWKLFQDYSVLKVEVSEEWLLYLFLFPDIVTRIETYSDLWKQAPTDD